MNERYDVALLHVYGYKEEKCPHDAPERPNIRTRLVIAAAREMYKRDQVGHFVFSGGPALGKSEPFSTISADDFIRKTHIEAENVAVNPSAQVTTSKELKTLKSEASVNQWPSSVSVGWEVHKERIEILARRILGKKTRHKVLSAEEILSTYPSERNAKRYARIIDAVHNSESERRWQAYEKRVLPLMRLPYVPELLDFVAKVYRPKAD